MNQTDPAYTVAMGESEMEFLINKKDEDVARQYKVLRVLIVLIVIISAGVAIGMFVITRLSPETFINANESAPNILLTSFKLMLGLLCVVMISTYYSYSKTVKKVIRDIKSGKKTIEPCIVIRKLYSAENDTYHVYITSNVRLSIQVTKDEYRKLAEGDKVNIEYSTYSKIFFGYFIDDN